MATLAEIRAKYPGAYDHVDDQALADALYTKYYSHADRQEFDARVGLKPYDGIGAAAAAGVRNLPQTIAGSGHAAAIMGAEAVKDLIAEPTLDPGVEPLLDKDGKPLPVFDTPLNQAARAAVDLVPGAEDVINDTADAVKRDQVARRAESDAWLAEHAPNTKEGSVEDIAYQASMGAMDMAAPMVASILLRNPGPMAAYGAFRSGSEGYVKAREAGLEPDQARLAAGLYAAAEAVTEAVGSGLLLEGGKTLVGAVVRGVGSEAATEAVTEALQAGIDTGIIGEEMTVEQALNRIKTAAIVGGVTGAPFAAAGHIARPKTPEETTIEAQADEPDPETPAPEQILALPAPGQILALPAPEAFTAPPSRHPAPPSGEQSEPEIIDQASVLETQARIALQRNKQQETAELLALAKETVTPVGAFTEEEIGPAATGKVRAQRIRTGRPVDAPITIADLAKAKVPQTEIDGLLAWRRPLTAGQVMTPSDVRAIARSKNLISTDANFRELALRTTGAANVERMSQAQLNALVTTIDGMPAQAEPTTVPITDMPNFSDGQYGAAVDAVRAKGRFTLQAIKDAAGVKSNAVATEIRDAMVRRGQLVHRGGSDYRLYDTAGTERQVTPADLPKGAFSEHTIKKMPVNQVRIKQDGKSLGTFDSATAARDKIRSIREAEARDGKKASALQIEQAADEAYAIMENRYDETGVLLGQVPVSTTRDRAEAGRIADQLNNPVPPLPAEATTPVTTKLGYRSSVVREGVQAKTAAAQPKKTKLRQAPPPGLNGRVAEVIDRVTAHVSSRGLPLLGVKTKLVNAVQDQDGNYHFGQFLGDVISLTTAHLDPKMTLDEITDALAQIVDHELVHALRRAGILDPANDTWATLARYVAKAKRPDTNTTYLDYARKHYTGRPGYDSADALVEEAIAEAFRVWAANKRNVIGKPAGIFRQLVQWFKELTLAVPNDIFEAIATGDAVRAALIPPGADQPRAVAVRQMKSAAKQATTAVDENVVKVKSREYIRARQQAREDRFGRSGPKTVIGTDASRNYNAGALGNRGWVAGKVVDYLTAAGRSSSRLATYLPEPMDFLHQVADAQQRAAHAPLRADVAQAYRSLATETLEMFKALDVKVIPWNLDGQPYASPAEMIADMAETGSVKLRLTNDLFGEGADNLRHPMLQPSGVTTQDGQPLLVNDLFRIVHDVYGRSQSGFRGTARDDYNAYHEHARLLPAEARRALATETLAQSAWHNYGPHLRRADGSVPREGDLDYLPSDQKEFAEQKAFLLPDNLLTEDPGLRLADAAAEAMEPKFSVGSPQFNAWFKNSKVVDAAGQPQRVFHGTARGNFNWFDTARSELGAHFGTIEQANDRVEDTGWAGAMHVYPTYLSIQNPLRLVDRGSFDLRDIVDQLQAQGFDLKPRSRAWTFRPTRKDNAATRAALKAAGYDGVVYLNRREAVNLPTAEEWGGGPSGLDELTDSEFLERYPEAQDSWVVFDPEQVKSAIANTGSYDPTNRDIRYAAGDTELQHLIHRQGATTNEIGLSADTGGRGAGGSPGPQADRGAGQAAPDRLPGLPASSPGPNANVIAAARRYLASMGMPLRRQAVHVKVDPERATRIADAYTAMPHEPENPRVLAAYKQMIEEVKEQYKAAIDNGLKVEIIRGEDPYPEGPKQVLEDLRRNHLWVYPTDAGFGSLTAIRDNPMLTPTEFMVGDHTMLANDLFRVVHDYFGHGLEGAGFGPSGEENAWQAHMRMFSPEAALAMTTETRGQNSWVNYGPYGEQNRDNARETIYADQKVGLLPEWAVTDGVADDQSDTGLDPSPFQDRLPGGTFFGDDRSPGAVLASPSSPALAFTAKRDGNAWFAGDMASMQLQMAREGLDGTMLTYMSTDEFLQLTGDHTHPEQNVFNAAVEEGLRFNAMPSLVIEGFAGNVRVVDSDGRYMAQALAGKATHIPVVIYSKARKEMGLITGLDPMRTAATATPVPMKPRAENYPADRDQGYPKFAVAAAFGQRAPAVGAPPVRNILRQRSEGIIGKFLASAGRSKRNIPILNSSIFDMRVRLQDYQLSVKEMIEQIEDAGGNVNDANHTYMQAQLYHGRVQAQLSQREEKVYQPLFDALREAVKLGGVTVEGFEDYLYAKHAPERNAYLRTRGSQLDSPSGMSDAEAIQILDKAAKNGTRATLETLARMAYDITADTTRTRNEAGLISDEAAAGSPFQFYVPLRGFAEEDLDPELSSDPEGLRAKTGKGFTIGGKEDRSMTGRERKAGDLLGHLLLQNTESVIRAEKNAVAISFMRLLKENPNSGYGIILESKPTRRVVGPNGMIHEAGDPNYKNDPTIVTAKYKGGEIVMRVEPRVARALRGDGLAAANTFVSILGRANRYLATVNTSMNPEFLISNLARDMQTAGILAQQYDIKGLAGSISKSVPAAMKGIYGVLRHGDAAKGPWAAAFREMQAAGGTTEFMGLHNIDTMVDRIRKSVATNGLTPTPRQALNQVQNLFQLINDVNATVENALRLGAYVKAREVGVSQEQAAYLAKNLTVNFNKGGEWKATANAMYLFYNASVAGSSAIVQGLKHKKVQRMAAAVITAGVLMDIVNRMIGDDEDDNGVNDYDDIPDYVLERNLVVMLPGSRNYISIPMPYGFNAFYNTGRNLSNMFSGSPVHNPGKSTLSIALGGLNAFNPLGGTNSISNFVAPTFLDPLVDLWTNKDFTGRDIVPDRMAQGGVPVPESQKYWTTTNPVYKWTAEQINALTGGDTVAKGWGDFSPETAEYAADFAMGGMGKFILRAGTLGASAVSGNWEGVEMDDVVFSRKLVGSISMRGNTEHYYQNAQDVLTVKARIDAKLEDGDAAGARMIAEGNRSRLPLIARFEESNRDLSALRKEIREARAAPITEERRREVIKQLQERMDAIMARMNNLFFATTAPQ